MKMDLKKYDNETLWGALKVISEQDPEQNSFWYELARGIIKEIDSRLDSDY